MGESGVSARRQRVLTSIIELDGELLEHVAELRKLGWDSEADLVTLTREHARRLLDRYMKHELDDASCRVWAEALEAREDVGFEEEHGDVLKQFIFELANPELFESLTPTRAETLKATLGAS